MQDSVVTIRTLECDACQRFDSLMLTSDEIKARAKATEMGIGAYTVPHSDHTRIVYFDDHGEYLGDTIAFKNEEIPDILHSPSIPFYVVNRKRVNLFRKLRKLLIERLHNANLTVTIAGPSRAGKTSLVRYLHTLLPERDSTLMPSVPTMGKSTQRIKVGNSTVTTLDLGGQKDFWDLWKAPIQQSGIVVFVFDATSNNLLEVAQSFERVISYRIEETPILVLLNKKDLKLRGEAEKFSTTGEFLSMTNLQLPLANVVAVESSVFEGKAYLPEEEVPLAEIITSFLKEHGS